MKEIVRAVWRSVERINMFEHFLLAMLFIVPLILVCLLVVLTILVVRP